MWSILVLINIIIHMFNPLLSALFTNGVVIYRLTRVIRIKNARIEKELLSLLIYLVPFSYSAIIGENHIFSMYNAILIIFIIYGVYKSIFNNKRYNIKYIILSVATIGFLLIKVLMSNNILSALIESIQMILIIFIVAVGIQLNKYYPLTKEELNDKMKEYIQIVFGTALAVIMQYILDRYLGIAVGNITYFPGRTIYDLLFIGYSVLSIYLGTGSIMIYIYTQGKLEIKDMLGIFMILLAIVVNSSRTGLVVCILMLGILFFKKIIKRITIKEIFMGIIALSMSITLIGVLVESRGINSIFDANGRDTAALEGIELFMKSPIIGVGLIPEDYKIMLPHNFIIQYLMQMGMIGGILVASYIFKSLIDLKDTKLKYLNIFILIGGLFVTDLHANTFYTVILIMAYISIELNDIHHEKIELK